LIGYFRQVLFVGWKKLHVKNDFELVLTKKLELLSLITHSTHHIIINVKMICISKPKGRRDE
jgi:hypothetical protein